MKEEIFWVEPPALRELEFKKMREISPNWEHFFHVTCMDPSGNVSIFKSCKSLDAAMHLWASVERPKKTTIVISVGSYGI